MRLVILIPAFNEAETIPELLHALPRTIEGIDEILAVVIDDGSTDGTGQLAAAAGARVIRHSHNLGIADVFRTAIRTCLELDADFAVSIDADLQFSPDEIPNLIEPILAGTAELVVGDRFSGKARPAEMPRIKYYGNRLMTGLVNLITNGQFTDVSSGYRAYSREALLNLNIQSSFTYTQESFIELAAKGFAIAQVPVTVKYYADRRSRVVSSIVRYALRTFLTIARTTRDYAPLIIFGWFSLIIIAPGFVLGLFVLAHYILSGTFSPYIFVAFTSAYLMTIGFGLLVLALVADMLRGIRANQERLLYYAKSREYETRNETTK